MLLALVAIIMPIGTWAMDYVNIQLSESGIATFYYSSSSHVIPEGIKASVITGVEVNEDGTVTVTEEEVEEFIPANCAVILRGESGSYEFLIKEDLVAAPESNLLLGSDELTTDTEEGYLYFTLDFENEENSASLKDWIYVDNEVVNQAHKAYLALSVVKYPELAAMLGTLDNPHLQHTHGGCEICEQETGVEATQAAWGASADDLTSYGTLDDAINAAAAEGSTVGYIQLQEDVETGVVINGGTFTLDLNGYTISSESHTLYIQNNSNVTIVDNSETNSGKVISSGEGSFAVGITNSASVTINGGTYESTHHYALNLEENSSVTINGGSYINSYVPVCINEGSSATIMGGIFEYTGGNAIIDNHGNLVVKGGTFTHDAEGEGDESFPTIYYYDGSIDLSNYPTDAIDSIVVINNSGADIDLCDETILLPEGYCFFDAIEFTPTTVLLADNTYYIDVEPEKYAVTFEANGGEGNMEGDNIYKGVNYTLPECIFTAPEGMMFKAWQIGGGEYQPGEDVIIEDNTTITAVWATPLEVSFVANGGTGSMDDILTIGDFTLPECAFTAPEGMMFKTWQIGEDEYQPYETVTIMGNTTITALWTDYIPQIVIKMHDSFGDGWHGDAIVVKMNGEKIDTATIEDGDGYDNIMRYEYDNTAEYTFYWSCNHEQELEEYPEYFCCPEECSFEIFIDDEEVFSAKRYEYEDENTSDCQSYEDGELIHTIEAKEAAELESLTINDGELTEYNNTVPSTTVGTLTYTRTLPNLMWNALYVPFEIPVNSLTDKYDVAYINDIRSYDNDENGEIDDMTMEIIRINSGTLNANHPYLIRAKNEEAQNMEIVLSDATLYRTEEISLNCSSMYMEFTITGTYNTLSYEDLEEKYAISTSGAWQKLSEGSSLKPFRLYMEMTPRDGSPVKVEAAALSRIRINMQGEDGNTTGVEILEAPQSINDAVLYDLYGRKVTTPVKGGIYISNGKKVIVK